MVHKYAHKPDDAHIERHENGLRSKQLFEEFLVLSLVGSFVFFGSTLCCEKVRRYLLDKLQLCSEVCRDRLLADQSAGNVVAQDHLLVMLRNEANVHAHFF